LKNEEISPHQLLNADPQWRSDSAAAKRPRLQGQVSKTLSVSREIMTEADFATLFVEHADAVVTILFGFVSITSGFLAASYLVARSIPKFLAIVLVGLYSVAGLALIGYCERLAHLFMDIRGHLIDMGANCHTEVTYHHLIYRFLS
jgi:hypothetical protein